MRKKILAVCDSEQDYAYHFLDYLSRFETEESFPFEVQVFTEASALKEFGEQNEIAILLIAQSLHLMEENWKADHILVLKNGKVREYGKTAQVLTAPEDPYTKELMSSVPRLKRTGTGNGGR